MSNPGATDRIWGDRDPPAKLRTGPGVPFPRQVRMSSPPKAPPSTTSAPARRRFSRGQRWVIRILMFLVLVTAALIGLALYTESRMADAGTLTALAPGDGIYLIVGSDSRENLPDRSRGEASVTSRAPGPT